ncbi:major facilitator superfamily domain-containing protein [Pestalotiopsis sp. NC0098]|nr:major facilitator superfamily domain-containing protein [Pestalotiopsis sp. NC0098]
MSSLDLKQAGPQDSATCEDEPTTSTQVDWTKEEESKATRKLDLIIIPLLVLGFFCLQLDRGNIANAVNDTLLEDQLLSLGIVLFEIPSNMILYKVGPGKWLTLQLFLFGLVSTFQAFQKNYGGYLATRFLLGMTESGYIPGGLWTLSTWYTREETAKRVMLFFFGNEFGQALSKLLGYGILHMKGFDGRPGWFWLFVIMGCFTICCGIILGFCFPDSFRNPHSTFLPRYHIFTPTELHILRTRVILDDPMKGEKRERIGKAAFKRALSNWRLWVHVAITLLNNGPFRALDTYSPTIVNLLGYPKLQSNAMASVGLFLQVPVSFVFSYISDRFNKRGETVMGALSGHMLGYILNRAFTELNNPGVRYFGIIWTQIFANFPHPLNIAWMSLACRDSEERSLAMAMIIMSANIGAIYGAQIFQSEDAPLYRRAFTINLSLLAGALVLAMFKYGDDIRSQRKRKLGSNI